MQIYVQNIFENNYCTLTCVQAEMTFLTSDIIESLNEMKFFCFFLHNFNKTKSTFPRTRLAFSLLLTVLFVIDPLTFGNTGEE